MKAATDVALHLLIKKLFQKQSPLRPSRSRSLRRSHCPSPSTLVWCVTWLYGLASKNGRIHGQLGCNLGCRSERLITLVALHTLAWLNFWTQGHWINAVEHLRKQKKAWHVSLKSSLPWWPLPKALMLLDAEGRCKSTISLLGLKQNLKEHLMVAAELGQEPGL